MYTNDIIVAKEILLHIMNTFAELLTLYVRRAGITDTELARSIGVSRQTIFRWREGVTGRPNKREDVLAIAEKLRLSDEERNDLLLAGGFRPDTGGTVEEEALPEKLVSADEPVMANPAVMPVTANSASPRIGRKLYYYLAGLAVIVLAVMLILVNTGGGNDSGNISANQTPDTSVISAAPITAMAGESLVLVAPFETGTDGADISELLVESIRREGSNNRLSDFRVEVLDESCETSGEVSKVLASSAARLLICGDTDYAGIKIEMTMPAGKTRTFSLTSADPVSISAVSLVALAEVCIEDLKPDMAFACLARARNLLADNDIENDSILTAVDELITSITTGG